MTWWQNWRHALAHPADNVVAAMVVLGGVAITAATTLLVSAANRRHEVNKDIRNQVYQSRAEIYVEAGTWLLELWDQNKDGLTDNVDQTRINDIGTRLSIYGTSDAASAFFACLIAVIRARRLLAKAASEVEQKATESERLKTKAEFDRLARRDVHGLRGLPRWFRYIKRMRGRILNKAL